MTTITLTQMGQAIKTVIETAPTTPRVQWAGADKTTGGQMTESIPNTPLCQLYPEEGQTDVSGETDRTTFRAGRRQSSTIFNLDYYAHQRANIAEDMKALVVGIDAIITQLEAQHSSPFFGLEGIKSFKWSWKRVIFDYGDPQARYVGVRFTLTLRTF